MMEVYIEEAVEYRFEGPANTEQFGYLILQLVNMKSNDSSIIEVRTFYDTNDIKVVQVQDNKTYSPVNTVQANGGTLLSEERIQVGAIDKYDLMGRTEGKDIWDFYIAR